MDCETEKEGLSYEGNIIRPPSEAFSIILQVTIGCSHNKCAFCPTYSGVRFRIKDEPAIIDDLAFAAQYMRRQDRLFITDGDGLVMPQKKLIWLLGQIRDQLPWVKRVGIYANAKSIRLKSDDELRRLKDLGLGIVYLGVETGDDEILQEINKGASAESLIRQGGRIMEAGMKLSVTVLLGIGGEERSLTHARATGRLLTRLDPDYVGALTLMLIPHTPLGQAASRSEFNLPDPVGLLAELKEMVLATDLSRGLFMANHASNYLPLKIRYPTGKPEALALIESALSGQADLKPEWMRAL